MFGCASRRAGRRCSRRVAFDTARANWLNRFDPIDVASSSAWDLPLAATAAAAAAELRGGHRNPPPPAAAFCCDVIETPP
jgi:hypothetical protein